MSLRRLAQLVVEYVKEHIRRCLCNDVRDYFSLVEDPAFFWRGL